MRKVLAGFFLCIPLVLFLCSPVPAQTPGTVKWQYPADNALPSSPALGPDGRIYYGTDTGLMVMEPNGPSRKWYLDLGNDLVSEPVIAPDGTAYFGAANWSSNPVTGEIYAYKEGQVKWHVPLPGKPVGLARDGTIYVTSYTDGKLHALAPADGASRWPNDPGIIVGYDMAIGPDGTLYIRSNSGLQAFTPGGALKWTYPGWSTAELIVDRGGIIYLIVGFWSIPSQKTVYQLVAVGPDSKKRWEGPEMAEAWRHLVMAPDGGFYGLSHMDNYGDGPRLNAVDARGNPRWDLLLPAGSSQAWPVVGLAVGADGLVYVGNGDGKLYAFRPDKSQAWVCNIGGYLSAAVPLIGPDGTVYTASTNRSLYAVYGTSLGVANSPWPMQGHDPQRTFRASGTPKPPLAALSLLMGD